MNIVGFSNNKTYTFYKEIKRLPPGHLLYFCAKKVIHSPVISIDIKESPHPLTYNEYLLGFREIFEKNLKILTKAHNNIGIELSGGLDSTTNLSVLKKQNSTGFKKIFTYSHSQSSAPSFLKRKDERSFIEATLQLLNVKQHRYVTRFNLGVIELYEQAFEKGNGTSAYSFPVYSQDFYKFAQKDGVNLILSGWGGDQAVSHRQLRNIKSIYQIPIVKQLYKKYQRHQIAKVRTNRIAKFLQFPLEEIIPELNGLIPGIENINSKERVTKIINENQQFRSQKSQLLRNVSNNFLIGRLEATFHLAQKYKVYYAYPMLSPELIEFVINLPSKVLFHPNKPRKFFKDAIAHWLPSEIVNRNKEQLYMYGWLMDSYKNDFIQGNTYKIANPTKEQLFYTIVHKNWDKKLINNLFKNIIIS